jgi:hypothetical protein
MSESVKAAQTLVWRAPAEVTPTRLTQFATLPGEKFDSVGGERGLSSQQFTRVSGMN